MSESAEFSYAYTVGGGSLLHRSSDSTGRFQKGFKAACTKRAFWGYVIDYIPSTHTTALCPKCFPPES